MREQKACHYCGKICDLDNHTLGDCNAFLKACNTILKLRAEAAEARVTELEAALESLRVTGHYECEDCYYSCPKHPECCGSDDDICTCGADKTNAIIDEALKGAADA